MNGREIMETIFAGDVPERFPLSPFGAWREAIDRWETEGLPEGVGHNVALGLQCDDVMHLPLNLGMVPEFDIQVLEKDEEYATLTDDYGVTKRMLRADFDRSGGRKRAAGAMSAMSHWIDFPVKDMRSWKEICEHRFQPILDGRLPPSWETQKHDFVERAETRWVRFGGFPFFGLFGPMRELMGLEGLLFGMCDNPDLIHTIVADLTDFWLATLNQILGDVRVDHIHFFEDMCGTKAPLLSPAMFREFIAPGYRKTIGGLREMGVRHFTVDSDGDVNLLIPELLAAGVDGIHPCEVNAHMDVAGLREEYPQLVLIGGIDKRVLIHGPKEIDAELERCFTVAWQKGGYWPSLDHAASPDMAWSNMVYFAERYRDWCGSPVDGQTTTKESL